MLKGSKISRYRILKVIDRYCLDLKASKTAVLLKLNRNTVNRYYGIFRRLVAAHQAKEFRLNILIHRATESPRNHLCNIWVSVSSGPERLGPRVGDVCTSVRGPLAAWCPDLSCST